LATVVIAVYTYTLWHVGSSQLGAVVTQIELARREFVSTHRPRIILREARIGTVKEGERLNVFFVLANIGESAGTVIRSVVDIEIVRENQPPVRGLNSIESINEIGTLTLAPGEARLIRFAALQKRPNSSEAPIWEAERFGAKRRYTQTSMDPAGLKVSRYYDFTIQIYGQFLYEDSDGLQRRTAFRRQLIPERQRFYRLEDDPDLDYAD
jgi:hypothetical protein